MEIVNRVAQSSLVSLDLEEFYDNSPKVFFDLKEHLFGGFVLREKDFREFLKNHDWQQYESQHLAVSCSTDAIIPVWAYMLVSSHASVFAKTVIFGTLQDLEIHLFREALAKINWENYRNAKVVVKGCSRYPVPVAAYMEASRYLRQVAASVMYGEPCSNVPIFKHKKSLHQ